MSDPGETLSEPVESGYGAVHRALRAFRPYSILAVLSIIWGIAFVAIRALEPLLTPVNLTLLRWFLASAGLLVLVPFLGKPKKKFERKDVPRLLLIAFTTVVAYHLTLNYSESIVSAGTAVLLVSIGPVFILILSTVFLREKHGIQVVLAIALAIVGASILSIGYGYESGSETYLGDLEAIGTALSYAIFAVFSKPLVQKYGARPLTIWSGLAGTLMLLPLLSGSFVEQVSALPAYGWAAILYLSLLSTVLGYMLFYTLIGRGSVTRLSVQLYLIPVVGVASGALLLGEAITIFTIIGGAAMLFAIAIATKKSSNGVNKAEGLKRS